MAHTARFVYHIN